MQQAGRRQEERREYNRKERHSVRSIHGKMLK
jgi:hypothetical protein